MMSTKNNPTSIVIANVFPFCKDCKLDNANTNTIYYWIAILDPRKCNNLHSPFTRQEKFKTFSINLTNTSFLYLTTTLTQSVFTQCKTETPLLCEFLSVHLQDAWHAAMKTTVLSWKIWCINNHQRIPYLLTNQLWIWYSKRSYSH